MICPKHMEEMQPTETGLYCGKCGRAGDNDADHGTQKRTPQEFLVH